ncbi:hypothetical protein [Brevundimonas sp.]|uniref:hypothetical protein n=1 Tax=Brevundimonas sp. TaxID=1871086 RepID=UPI002FC90B32
MRATLFPAAFAALGLVAVAWASDASAGSPAAGGQDEAALEGKWSEREVVCDDQSTHTRPVRELVFTADGRFTLTWEPFESFTDYWGVVVHDAASGVLRMEVADTNSNPPAQVLTGVAELTEGGRRLILSGIDLGDGQRHHWGRRCRYVFGRI